MARVVSRNKVIILLIFLILTVVVLFYSFNNSIHETKQPEQHSIVEAYAGTLNGEYTCLPHQDTNEPQTLECSLGLRTDSYEYYALDFSPTAQNYYGLTEGMRLSVSGMINPMGNIMSDLTQKYEVEGIMSVSEFQVIE